MNQRQLSCCVSAFLLASTLTLATGCGSVSSNSNPTPTPTPTLGATPTPTPVATPSPSPTPTPVPSNAAITGRVLDPSGAPVQGTVIVALVTEGPPLGGFSILKQTNADAQGNFRFDNVPAVSANFESYSIVVAARQANGDLYAPALLLPGTIGSFGFFGPGDPIIPGTNVGTIGLRFSTQGSVEGNVTSTDSTQKVPVPIHVTMSMGIFMNDRVLQYPLIDAPAPFDTAAGPACPAGTACFAYRFNAVPADIPERAVFNKAGYTFTPSEFGVSYEIFPSATSLLNGKPTCNPPSLVVFANGLNPNSPNQAGPDANFTSCR